MFPAGGGVRFLTNGVEMDVGKFANLTNPITKNTLNKLF